MSKNWIYQDIYYAIRLCIIHDLLPRLRDIKLVTFLSHFIISIGQYPIARYPLFLHNVKNIAKQTAIIAKYSDNSNKYHCNKFIVLKILFNNNKM